jgi:glycerol kinase
MKTHLLALDQGTSSSRSIVFDGQGRIVAMAQREFRPIYPQPGWVEHDPLAIWDTQLATAREALAKSGLTAADTASIGITNQRETTVVWNRRTGLPVYNAIVWRDRRAEPTCAALRAQGHEALFRRRIGLIVDAYFSGTKLKWILDHVDGARAAAECGELAFGSVDSWLLWQLTGGAVHATDVSNAALAASVSPAKFSSQKVGFMASNHATYGTALGRPLAHRVRISLPSTGHRQR